jgi:hypothetical protein
MRLLILWKSIHSSQISHFLLMSPNISLRVPLPMYHSNRIHYMWQQCHLMNPWNISPKMSTLYLNHSNNYCWTFQILPGSLSARKTETTEYRYHYRMQHVSVTTEIFKYISDCIFHRTHLMAMHNTVMTSNTNAVPHSKTQAQFPSRSAEPLTVSQCKYWGNSASQNMTLYMALYTLCLKYQVQTETTLTPQNAQHYKVILYTLSTPTQQVPNLHRFKYAICRYKQFSFSNACFYLNSFSTSASMVLSTKYAVYIL